MQQDQHSSGNNAGHSIVHGSNHFHQFNLRDNQTGHPRHMVGGSLNNVNLMASADSSLNTSITGQNPGPTGASPNPSASQGGVQLNKKMMGNRKRNNREKSYDSYNQKLQLPPMIKTPQDRADRTYSVPNGQGAYNSNPGNNTSNHHQYMLPLSPGGGGQGHQNSITPKTSTHAQIM